MWLDRGERDWLLPLLRQAPQGFPGYRHTPYAGGRGATVRVEHERGPLAIRAGIRGGLPGRLWSRTYFGFSPRVRDELEVTAYLRQRGVAVPQPLGAVVQWRAPGCYRSWFATAALDGTSSLIRWLERSADAAAREHAAEAIGSALRHLHRAGVTHPDLNLHNILVSDATGEITLIDFDRARIADGPVEDETGVLRRLSRSAARLDPNGRVVTATFLAQIRTAYRPL